MHCDDVVEALPEFHEHALEAVQRRAVQTHLQHCEACRQVEFELRASWAMLDAWPEVEPSAGFVARVMQQVEPAAAERRPAAPLVMGRWSLRRSTLSRLTTAAAIALISIVLFVPHGPAGRDEMLPMTVRVGDDLHDVLHKHDALPEQDVLEDLLADEATI